MIVSIHQPAYLPWMGYFDKIARADHFIYMDNVQFQKNSFQNRNKVRSKSGPVWLTVPVETSGRLYDIPLGEVTIDNRRNWRAKHAATLRMNYTRARNFKTVWPLIEPVYEQNWDRLSDLCWEMLKVFLDLLDIRTPLSKASSLSGIEGSKSDLVLSLCRRMNATQYLSGKLGRDYLDEAVFAKEGIEVVYQEYQQPVYPQLYEGFEPFMAILDLLFCDADPARHFRKP